MPPKVSIRHAIAAVVALCLTLLASAGLYLQSSPLLFEDPDGDSVLEGDESSRVAGLEPYWSDLKSGLGKFRLGWGTSGPDRTVEARRIRQLLRVMNETHTIETYIALERLASCFETHSCGPGEDKVVIFACEHFEAALWGSTSGEDIWASSTIEALQSLNYTLLWSNGVMDTLLMYEHIPDLVRVIIWEGSWFEKCMWRTNETYLDSETDRAPGTWQMGEKACIKSERYPQGIPVWKSFAFHFWKSAVGPLGHTWTLAPEDFAGLNGGYGNQFLGYSIESYCRQRPYYRPEERKHRGLVLAKSNYYFFDDFRWPSSLNDAIAATAPAVNASGIQEEFELVVCSQPDGNAPTVEPYNVNNLGPQSRDEWMQVLGRSKFMLGIGKPAMSPSPYDALCLGVPFLNPSWDTWNPEDRTKWDTQHDGLISLDPPYVYHVYTDDVNSLQQAFQQAIDNPIEPFIPPKNTLEAVRERHRLLVETEWLSTAQEYVQREYLDLGKEWDLLL